MALPRPGDLGLDGMEGVLVFLVSGGLVLVLVAVVLAKVLVRIIGGKRRRKYKSFRLSGL